MRNVYLRPELFLLLAAIAGAGAHAEGSHTIVCGDKGCKPIRDQSTEAPADVTQHTVKANVKTRLESYVFIDLNDCSSDLGSWSLLSRPKYGISTTEVVDRFDLNVCPNVNKTNARFYTWTNTDQTVFKDTFKSLWSTIDHGFFEDTFNIIKMCPEGKFRDPKSKKCLLIDEQYEEDVPPDLGDWEEDPCYGNPMMPLRGAKVQVQPLGIRIGGHDLILTYDSSRVFRNSLDEALDPMLQPLTHSFDFGLYWASSLHKKVVLTKNAANAVDGALVHIGSNRLVKFVKLADGSFKAAVGNTGLKLSRADGGFQFKNLNEGWLATFDGEGKLKKLVHTDGQYLTFAYSTADTDPDVAPEPGLMIKATDASGRFIEFHYKSSVTEPTSVQAVVSALYDSNGQSISFWYDRYNDNYRAQLSGITWQDLKLREFSYEWPTDPNSKRPWALVGVTDEERSRLSTFTYDVSGAVASTVTGDKGALSYIATAGTPGGWRVDSEGPVGDRWRRVLKPAAPVDLVIQGPNLQPSTITSDVVAGRTRLLGRSQPAGAGCKAATSSAVHDPGTGNVTERVSFGGKKSCHNYLDSRALESVRLVGLDASDSSNIENCPTVPLSGYTIPPKKLNWQKDSTRWDDEWNLKSAEAAPGLITYWVYNGRPHPIAGGTKYCAPDTLKMPDGNFTPVLCEVIRQPTTDGNGTLGFAAAADGQARTVSMDYDSTGRLLQRVGEAGAADTVKLAYYPETIFVGGRGHYKGDLMSSADQSGFATTFDEYDKSGHVLKMTLPTQEVRQFTYTSRGMLERSERTAPGESTPLVELRKYYDTGLLKCVRTEQGPEMRYDYDTAHRLIHTLSPELPYYVERGYRPSGELDELLLGQQSWTVYEYDHLERVKKVTQAKMPPPWSPSARGVPLAQSRMSSPPRVQAADEWCSPENGK